MKRRYKVILYFILFLVGDLSFSGAYIVNAKEKVVKRSMVLMGSLFDITVVAEDSLSGNRYIDLAVEEISRIEDLISEWRAWTPLSQVNAQAGIAPVIVSEELFKLTKTAISFSEQSSGAFDITIAAMDKIWRFDGSMDELPSANEVAHAIRNVGYRGILLDSCLSTIFLKHKGMKIGFGATGKGYAADRARKLLQNAGVTAGIVNASGDMAVWGNPPHADYWRVGVTNPFSPDNIYQILELRDDVALATSGDYEKYVEFDEKRYSHIINPTTGYPVEGLVSVTVIGQSAEIANGISTSIMVLGVREGEKLLKQYPGYRAIIISDDGEVVEL